MRIHSIAAESAACENIDISSMANKRSEFIKIKALQCEHSFSAKILNKLSSHE